MGCKTCKQKNQNGSVGDNNLSDIELIPKSFIDGEFSGNILLKIIAFAVVLLAMPLVLLVLVGQIFITFFLPKSLPKVTKKLKSGFMFIIGKYAEFKYKREMKKRQKQFGKNRGYEEDSELVNVENYTDINIHEKNNDEK
tara:strand:+ start:1905 stop:2324 length:420 start_codon:yes stop_codon:yes gene_type:complete